MIEDEMVGWHYQLDGHEFKQALGVGDGQGSLLCCSPWGPKECDMTERLNSTEKPFGILKLKFICLDFLYCPVVKNLPTQHRGHSFHAWPSKIPHAEEQLSPDTITTKPLGQSP